MRRDLSSSRSGVAELILAMGLVCFGMVSAMLIAGAHEDIIRQIRSIDSQIAASPGNVALLLKRADLFRRHREWDRAAADIEAAAVAGAKSSTIGLARAGLELERGRPQRAIEAINRTDWDGGIPPAARLTLARADAALGRRKEADRGYALALEKLSEARPDHYVEWADVVAASGTESWSRAVTVLDAGAARFHDAVTLHERAVALERGAGRTDDAIRRVEGILRTPAASVQWRVALGDLLVEAGRSAEAVTAYRQAAAEIHQLPIRRRSAPAMQKLARDINTRLAALPAADSPR